MAPASSRTASALSPFCASPSHRSDFASGQHGYRISSHGIEIYPRIADPFDPTSYDVDRIRVSTGIAALDDLLHDGYWRGASTLVAGPTGSGKTLMGLHFVYGGLAAGEPGIFATLQESQSQLGRIAAGTATLAALKLLITAGLALLVDLLPRTG